MFKKLLLAFSAFVASISIAYAAIDVNKATQAELDSIKGIGPAISKAIVDERAKGGAFKDWADFETRVKGVGEKSGAKMSEAGLTVAGKSFAGAPPKAEEGKKEDKEKAKAEKAAKAKANKEEKAQAKAEKDAKAKADKETNTKEATDKDAKKDEKKS